MRIGFLSQALPYLPSRGGFRLYGANLIRHLARRHEVDLVSLLVDDDAAHLDWARRHCASVRAIPVRPRQRWLAPVSAASAYIWGRPLQQRATVGRLLRSGEARWDVLHVEGPYVGGLVPETLRTPRILSVHDSWTLRCDEMLKCSQSLLQWLYYRVLRYQEPRFERLVYPRFGRCVFVTARDAAAVHEIVPRANCVVVPNGVDTEYFQPQGEPKNAMTVAFHGHLGYAPNVDAAVVFAEQILPTICRHCPDVVFQLVGADPSPKIRELAKRPNIRLSANLPDLRSVLASSRVYACPVQLGSGIKNKILEAMALELPVVSFQAALEGIGCTPGCHVLVARDADEFAALVIELLKDPVRAERMGQAGRTFVQEAFSWESRAVAFEGLYHAVLDEYARTPLSGRGTETKS